MSSIFIERTVNLNGPIIPDTLTGVLNCGEVDSHEFTISATLDNEPFALSGVVTASFIRSDGVTVPLTGSISDGAAVVVLSDLCYNVPGRFAFTVFITSEGVTTAIYGCTGTVRQTDSGSIVDPGEIIPSVSGLITSIENAIAEIPADYSQLLATQAPTFSATTPYVVGSYVWYDGTLYRFTAAHAAGSWTGSDATAVTIGGELADFMSTFNEATEVLNYFHVVDQEKNGITVTNTPDGILLNGTANPTANFMIGNFSGGAEAGEYTGSFAKVSGTASSTSGVSVRYWSSSSSSARWLNESNTNLPIPACRGVSLTVSSGATVTDYLVKIQISKGTEAGEYYSESLSAIDVKARKDVADISGATNLFEHYTEKKSGVTITKNADGTYTINGTASEAVAFTSFVISPGAYTAEISAVSGAQTGNGLSIRYGTGGTLWTAGGKTEHSFDDDTIVYLRASPATFTDYTVNVKIISVSHPNTAIDYVVRYNAETILPTGTFVPTNILGTFAMGTCVNKRTISVDNNTTVIAYGDSITRGTEGRNPWVYYFAEITGCSIINKAVGNALFGESVRPVDKWISTQIANTTSAEWESAGLIVLAAGTNDIGGNTPAAELKEKVQSAITTIKANTNAPILFITPIWRGESSTDPDLIRIPYVAGIIRSVALENRCSVINGLDFPIPSWSNGVIEKLTADGLHPNNAGAYIYAMCVVNAID